MKPPPETQRALFVLYFFTLGLASQEDVEAAARQLDEEQLMYFRLMAGISYIQHPELAERVWPITERLRSVSH